MGRMPMTAMAMRMVLVGRSEILTPEVLLLVSGVLLVLGVLITTVCALLSINKYLRMKASTLYAV